MSAAASPARHPLPEEGHPSPETPQPIAETLAEKTLRIVRPQAIALVLLLALAILLLLNWYALHSQGRQLNALSADVSALNGRVVTLAGSDAQLRDLIDNQFKNISNDVNSKRSLNSASLRAVQDRLAETSDRLDHLQAQVAASRAATAQLETRVAELQRRQAALVPVRNEPAPIAAAPAITNVEVKPALPPAALDQPSPMTILSKPKPKYTEEALRARIEGDVVLSAIFGADGKVKVLGIKQGLGHGLDQTATAAAQQIVFKPATQNGQAVDFPAVVRISYSLAY